MGCFGGDLEASRGCARLGKDSFFLESARSTSFHAVARGTAGALRNAGKTSTSTGTAGTQSQLQAVSVGRAALQRSLSTSLFVLG